MNRPSPRILQAKRSFDARGEVAILVGEGEPAEFVEYLEFANPGVIRGGHVHHFYTEHLYVAGGQLRAELLDCTGATRSQPLVMDMQAGMTLEIPPGWAHRFIALEASRAVAWGRGGSPLSDRESIAAEDWGARRA
jgi:dTDP-4-dehydrorhamnose 3,5-epimerase-like enzyme